VCVEEGAIKRILVPVDGSDAATRALRVAAERVRGLEAELHVLHVEPAMTYEELRVYVVREDLDKMRHDACQRVLTAAAQVLAAEKVAHVEHLRQGEVAQTIAQMAQSQAMDEVVMGTRGMGTLGALLLGSVAYRVVHLVHVPVTRVK
jgi:nucleotide-binding universal stress UspA family protein